MTATSAPEPQVVAWMRAYRRQHPDMLNDNHTKASLVNRYRREHGPSSLSEVAAAYDEAWRPLTVDASPARQGTASLDALAQAVDCDTAETVRWEIAETLDKCAGTKERILEQTRAGKDCDTCPPGFLAVVMQAENLARALGIALDLLGVAPIDTDKEGQ